MNSINKQIMILTAIIVISCVVVLYIGITPIGLFQSFPVSWSFVAIGLITFFGVFLISMLLEEKETSKNDKMKNAIVSTLLVVYIHVLSVYIFDEITTAETEETKYIIGNFTNLFGIVIVSYFSASSVESYIKKKDNTNKIPEVIKSKPLAAPDPVPTTKPDPAPTPTPKPVEPRSALAIDIKKSENYNIGRKGHKPEMIVCHITEGSYEGAVNWLADEKSNVSAHFVVSKDGRITRLVDISDTAWANGTSTDSSSQLYYKNAINNKVKARSTNANKYTVSIEHEGLYRETQGLLTQLQKNATIRLIQHIREIVKERFGFDIPLTREGIIGHYEINPITRPNCPGEDFPFEDIINELKKEENNNSK